MNPMNLLTTGKTILGLKERPGRYKLRVGGAVPKFSKLNQGQAQPQAPVPIVPHQEVQSTQTAFFEPSSPRKGKEMLVVAKDPPAIPAVPPVNIKAKAQPLAASAPVPEAADNLEAKPGLWSEVAGWVQKWIPARKTPPSPLESFQAELALERIKVIRNDLSEDDLEVVMIDRKVGNKAKPVSERVDLEKIAASP
jgi:hypothetical protein